MIELGGREVINSKSTSARILGGGASTLQLELEVHMYVHVYFIVIET